MIPGHINAEAKDLLQRLLCVDAEKRITASEVLMHPLFYLSQIQTGLCRKN
jgi:serine/threonine protein kinase